MKGRLVHIEDHRNTEDRLNLPGCIRLRFNQLARPENGVAEKRGRSYIPHPSKTGPNRFVDEYSLKLLSERDV